MKSEFPVSFLDIVQIKQENNDNLDYRKTGKGSRKKSSILDVRVINGEGGLRPPIEAKKTFSIYKI